jgi:predicted alternative tryptophan synthase beta-subunit
MATYKEIFGTNIEVLASDPANPVTGQVWYNSTDNVVKGQGVTTAGAWATGGSLNTARFRLRRSRN